MSTIFLGIQPQNDIAHLMKKNGNNWNKSCNHPQRWKSWTHQHHHIATKQNIAHSKIMGGKLQEKPKYPKTKGGNQHHHTSTKQNIALSRTTGRKLEENLKHPKTKSGNQHHHTTTKQNIALNRTKGEKHENQGLKPPRSKIQRAKSQ